MGFAARAQVISMVCAGLAAQETPVFRSHTDLVRIDAEVSEPGGRIVEGLRAADFRVLDEGREQTISGFTFDEDPLDVILLFDDSRNMRSKLPALVRAVELGLHELRQGDRACVMAFSGTAVELAPFTTDFERVNQTILIDLLRQRFGGPARVAAAVSDAAGRFGREPVSPRRRAVLIVTAQAGAGERAREEERAVRDLWENDAVAGELWLGSEPGRGEPVMERTGGPVIAAEENPGGGFQDALRHLRRRYSMFYRAPSGAAGEERRIRVVLSREAAARFPGARVYARDGYRVR